MDKIKEIKKIISPIQEDLDIFENSLKKIIDKSNNFLKNDLNSFMFSNPKRLRPIFVFLFARILNIKNNEIVQNIALSLELLHNASLVHDDIIDNEKTRRNNPTFFEKYGSKLAVLEGDLLLCHALKVLSNTNIEILSIFTDKIEKTLNGEIGQNSTLENVADEKDYFKKTFNKTGNLFFAGLESLFKICPKNNYQTQLEGFLKNYTLAFQIKNDIDNIKFKDATDFKNGNYTLPVLYFMKENQGKFPDFSDESFKKYLIKAQNKVEEFKTIALNFLKDLDETPYKTALKQLSDFTLRSEF